MKRTVILTILTLVCFTNIMFGQGKDDDTYISYLKNEIFVQYGAPSIVEMTNKLGNDTYNGPNITRKFKGTGASYTGIAAAGYNRYLNPYFCVGAYIGTGESQIKAKETESGKIVFSSKVRNITCMANFGWTYYRNGIWDISCGVSGGFAHKDENIRVYNSNDKSVPTEDDNIVLAYNFTVLKVRVGGGIIGGFAEFGFGYKGVANAGLSIRF